ncbi:MAG: DUF1579 family protein [Phycisphaerales bacterium]
MCKFATFSLIGVGAAAGFMAAGLVSNPAGAEPEKKPAAPAIKAPADAVKAAADAAMMEAFMKASTPGEHHKLLEPFAGTWDCKAMFHFDESQPPEQTSGTMKNSWVLGGRLLRQEWTGTMMGLPFEGLGYWGHDNVEGKFIGMWMDTFGTGWMTSTGDYDAKARAWTMRGSFKDPMGAAYTQRQVIASKSDKENTMEIYHTAPDGKERLAARFDFTRK